MIVDLLHIRLALWNLACHESIVKENPDWGIAWLHLIINSLSIRKSRLQRDFWISQSQDFDKYDSGIFQDIQQTTQEQEPREKNYGTYFIDDFLMGVTPLIWVIDARMARPYIAWTPHHAPIPTKCGLRGNRTFFGGTDIEPFSFKGSSLRSRIGHTPKESRCSKQIHLEINEKALEV